MKIEATGGVSCFDERGCDRGPKTLTLSYLAAVAIVIVATVMQVLHLWWPPPQSNRLQRHTYVQTQD